MAPHLIMSASYNALLAILLYILDKKTVFSKVPYNAKQLIIGVLFNPLERAEPDITLSAADREIGGLGIFITKKTMDTVSYENKDGKNILTMTKKI